MARRLNDCELIERAKGMLPKGIPSSAVISVDSDLYDGEDGGASYWVYLDYGYQCTLTGCHTIHDDTLKDLKVSLKHVVPWPDDPQLKQKGWYDESFKES